MTSTTDETTTGTRPDPNKKASVDLVDVASWDGSRLVFHESAMSIIRREALSPSTSKAMTGCTAKWAASRLLPRGGDPFSAAELGTSVHSILEDLYERPYYMRSREEALRILDGYKAKMWPGGDDKTTAKAAEWHGKVYNLFLNEKSGLWTIENPMQVKVAGLEQGFKPTTTVCDIPFNGFIDRTDLVDLDDGTKGIKLVDYKTGKVPKDIGRYGDEHGDQMRLYAEAYYNETGTRPVEATLIYTQHGKARTVPLSKPAMSKTLTGYRKSWGVLKKYEAAAAFPTQVGPLCGWCPLVNTCPVAKADGKVDRTGTAPKSGDMHIPVMNVIATTIPVYVDNGWDADGWDVAEPAAAGSPDADQTPDQTAGTPVVPLLPEVAAHAQNTAENTTGFEAENGHELAPAAHLNGASLSTPTPEATAMTGTAIFSQNKRWITDSDNMLNADSNAAIGAFGFSTLAYEELRKADVALKGNIDALSQTFSFIVETVQMELGRPADDNDYDATHPGSGLNTRLRGILRSFIDIDPIPFGSSEDVWDEWVGRAINHSRSIARAAQRLYVSPTPDRPWAGLATTRPQAVNG